MLPPALPPAPATPHPPATRFSQTLLQQALTMNTFGKCVLPSSFPTWDPVEVTS